LVTHTDHSGVSFRLGQVIWNVGDRIGGTAPYQLAVRRMEVLMVESLDEGRDR
jgi:hypothetical protein